MYILTVVDTSRIDSTAVTERLAEIVGPLGSDAEVE
jgi:hypothetical protein